MSVWHLNYANNVKKRLRILDDCALNRAFPHCKGDNFTAWPKLLDNLERIVKSWRPALYQSPVSWMFVTTSGTRSLSQDPESCSREARAADWCSWIWQKYLLSTQVHSHHSSRMAQQILEPNVSPSEPRVREQRCIPKTKVPVPRDHRVRRSRGDAREGDWLLVICCGVEGLLEHRQHWRNCRHINRREEKS